MNFADAPIKTVWEDCLWFHKMRVNQGKFPDGWENIVSDTIELIKSAPDDLLLKAFDDGSYQQLLPRLALTISILEYLEKAKTDGFNWQNL